MADTHTTADIHQEKVFEADTVACLISDQEVLTNVSENCSALIFASVTGQIDVTTYAKSGTPDRRLDSIQAEMGA